jgi:hypothetical protein
MTTERIDIFRAMAMSPNTRSGRLWRDAGLSDGWRTSETGHMLIGPEIPLADVG